MAVKSKKNQSKETPLMKQFNAIKVKHPDALLLFRVGDFYETFGQDAVKAASVLGIVLTKRHNGSAGEVELAGFPHHSLNTYLPKLVRSGLRVAVCDQLEDPKLTKTIVKRGVTELVTPGVVFSEDVLEQKENNFLAAVHFDKNQCGVAFLDVSTGEMLISEGSTDELDRLMQQFKPSEVVYQKQKRAVFHDLFADSFYTYALEDWAFGEEFAKESLNKQFGTSSLKGFGVEDMPDGLKAAGAAFEYLSVTQNNGLKHIKSINRIDPEQYVWLDRFTVRNLELLHSQNENAGTLISVLDRCKSPMGSRLLRRWVIWPSKDLKEIVGRHECVRAFLDDEGLSDLIKEHLSELGDMERLVSKIAVGKVNPREVNYLGSALTALGEIRSNLESKGSKALKSTASGLDPCSELRKIIAQQLNPDAPNALNKGEVIRSGVNKELDELRFLRKEGKQYLLDMQIRETERTGITSLKVAYNNVFGYYIEVRNSHKDKVPEEWIRKQTLVNAERYITDELKEYESKILSAEERIERLEAELFTKLIGSIEPYIDQIQKNARIAARIDCLLSFAHIAGQYNYTQAQMNDGLAIDIQAGRHPVIERRLPIGEDYVANDVFLDNEVQQILMITGPNMAGKSALLRQTALIVLMAQTGSFVPAAHASIGLVDKIFTRVGASDNISEGESTFMVEMNETASIMNNITDRSLILLDEIGRGTSTYDGVSIAWSIAEFLHENGKARPKTLFATHYHELNDMKDKFPRIVNFNVSVKEIDNQIVFVRKLKPGGSAHSFGIHVAKMAGMPISIVRRANDLMKKLESKHQQGQVSQAAEEEGDYQLSFFQLDDPVLENIKDELTKIDIDNLTPVEALMKLNEIKKLVGGK
ncbi:MAG: DNA mismatch repair protein MutS [Vicingaceae bacterium]